MFSTLNIFEQTEMGSKLENHVVPMITLDYENVIFFTIFSS